MNRKLYLGIMGLFVMIFIISITFLPYYNPIYFYVQHISLFLFMAMFIFGLLNIAYRRLSKRITNASVLKGFTLIVFTLLMFGFSSVQLIAIDKYQTPDFQSCFYYDEFGNAIFYSQLVNSCPELEAVEKTSTLLSFKVIEENSGTDNYDYIEDLDLEDVYYESTVTTDVEITYDLGGNILESDSSRWTELIIHDSYNVERKIYNHVSSLVQNETIYDGDDPIEFISYQRTMKTYDMLSSQYDPKVPSNTQEYIKYIATKIYHENNDNIKEDVYQIVVSKEEYDNYYFEGEPVSITVLQQFDFVCDDEECRVQRQDFDVSQAEYVVLQETGFTDSNYDYTYTIKDNEIEMVYPHISSRENEKTFSTVVYSNFKDFEAFVFESDSYTATNRFSSPIDRASFRYNGNYYIEHGDVYSVIYEMEYGYKVVNKMATMEYEQSFDPPIIYSSSISFEMNHFYRIENIYDYGLRSTYDLSDRDEIFYQKNAFIYALMD